MSKRAVSLRVSTASDGTTNNAIATVELTRRLRQGDPLAANTDVGAIIASGLSRELGFDAPQKAALTAVVSDWFHALPEDYLDQVPTPSGDLESAHRVTDIVVAARHMLELMRRVSQLDLSATQREFLRNSKQVLVLRRTE